RETVGLAAARGDVLDLLDPHARLGAEVIGEQPGERPQRRHAVRALDDELRARLHRLREERQGLSVRTARIAAEAPPIAGRALESEGARLIAPQARGFQPRRRPRCPALGFAGHTCEGRGCKERERGCECEEGAHASTLAIGPYSCNADSLASMRPPAHSRAIAL